MRMPLAAYYLAVDQYGLPARGLLPDYPIKYSIREELLAKDKETELALQLARNQKAE